ncbi:hypothetical protein JHK86_048256 [Glycine max]|nr:hypothetical protein JHK86_048256 [Glycine max]
MGFLSPKNFIFWGCILGLFLGYLIASLLLDLKRRNSHSEERKESQTTQIVGIEYENTQSTLPTTPTHIVLERVRDQMEPYWHEEQLLSFVPRAYIARISMRALPPVTCFCDDETTGSKHDCPICIEEFKNGELIQPFGVCVHEFHSSCINSWLLSGKTTCPVCRKELIYLIMVVIIKKGENVNHAWLRKLSNGHDAPYEIDHGHVEADHDCG